MKITKLELRNYRTFEHLDLDFPASFAAICGPNDAGKTNVVRAIGALMKTDSSNTFIHFAEAEEVSAKDDYPKWKNGDISKREISIALSFAVDRARDTGFSSF